MIIFVGGARQKCSEKSWPQLGYILIYKIINTRYTLFLVGPAPLALNDEPSLAEIHTGEEIGVLIE